MADPALLGSAADIVPGLLLLICPDGAVLDCNHAARTNVPGMQPGAGLFDLVTDPPEEVRQTLTRWARTGDPVPGTLTFRGHHGPLRCRCRGDRAGGRRPPRCGPGATGVAVQVHASPVASESRSAWIRDRVTTLNREVSYRQRTAAEAQRMLVAEQRLRERAQRLHRLSAALAAASTLAEVARVVRTDAAASLGGTTAVLGLFPDRALPSFRESGTHQTPRAWHDLGSDPGSPLATAALAGGPSLITSPARPLAPYSATAARRDHSAHCVPLELQGQRLGVLAVAVPPAPPPSLLAPGHTATVAAQVAQALARARLFEHEHRLAEWLQRSLLPTLPATPGLTVATRYLPNTESALVGGDWYDLFSLGPDTVGLAIGDVAGHSLAEATVMAQLQNALRAFAMEHRPPGATLRRLNEFTYTLLPEAMATACYLTFNMRSGWLSFACAGHLPPLLVPAGRPPRLLRTDQGPPLGAVPGARYPVSALRIRESDTLVLYTDGLVEQRGEPLDTGLDRLLATARLGAGRDPGALCDILIHGQPGTRWQDDRALLAVRFGSAAPGRARRAGRRE